MAPDEHSSLYVEFPSLYIKFHGGEGFLKKAENPYLQFLKMGGVYLLTGANVILSTVEQADLPANYRWGNDRELIRLSGMHPYPRSGWEIEKWFQAMNTNPASRLFAIRTRDGRYIGNIELSNIDGRSGCAEVGLVIGEKGERGKGYGRDAILTILKFAFGEMRLHRVFARVLEFNEAAVKCFKSSGFKEEGRERQAFFSGGAFNDVIIFGIIESEFPG